MLFKSRSRYTLVWVFLILAFLFFSAIRLYLLLQNLPGLDLTLLALIKVFVVGGIYDLAFYGYFLTPFLLYLWLAPERLWASHANRVLVAGTAFVVIYGLFFIAVAENLFWDEFGVRFNFISVDYLVYRREVTNNILESYPIGFILPGLFILSGMVMYFVWPYLRRSFESRDTFRSRSLITLVLALLPAIAYTGLDQELRKISANVYQVELASNGPYQFFAAFRNNELDYEQFYYSIDPAVASVTLKHEVEEPTARFWTDNSFDIGRSIDNPGKEQHYNIMLVMVESLSADFLGYFGNSQAMTPKLDGLIDQSLFFTNLYATGTRTTRGLEAVTLSIPPTPGRSIVKRLGREGHMYSLGNVLKKKGYETEFIYGGHGFFDNMNAFFSGNGYGVIDQGSAPEEAVTFENAWGMADENLFDLALQAADEAHARQQPFFFHIMTTSNHRPYTYPEGRINIPSGSGRSGAVKYTDFAIGELLQQAQSKPWFDNTVFVIVADHTAGAAGKQALPLEHYHIPMWVYAPKLVRPGKVNTLASQIDVAPTLLALLNMDYDSFFFGKNILAMPQERGRALIGNYQNLALYENDTLTILSPPSVIRQRRHPGSAAEEEVVPQGDDPYLNDAASFYEGADIVYHRRLNAWRDGSVNSNDVVPHS